EAPLDRLQAVLDRLTHTRSRIVVDLSEMLGFGYYTGFVFHAWVPGLGQAIASGGRYDHLLGRYGRELAACGFAIDEEGLTEVRSRPGSERGTE
ncbi:MAG: ATP phosphoribosyltransferase regulatory subunit, partial [Myxococcota bacterium]